MFEIHNPTASVTQLLVALVACFIPDSRCHQKASDGDFWNPKDVHRSEHGWGSRFSTVEILYYIVPTWCIRRNLLMGCAIRKLAGFIPMAAQFLVCSWNWSPVLSTTGRREWLAFAEVIAMTCYDHVRETCHSLWNTRGTPMWMNASLLWDGSSFWCMILLILLMCLSHSNSFVFRDPGCCKAEPDTAPDSPALSVPFQRDSSDLSQSMSQECRPEMGLLRPGRTAYMYIKYKYIYIHIIIHIYIYIHLIQLIHVLEHVSPVTASLTLAAQVSCNPYGWIWWKAENSNTALEPAILSVQIRSFNWLGDLTWGILGHNAQTPFLQTAPAQCPFPASCGVWTLIDIRCDWQSIGRKIEKSVWLCLVIAASVCKRPERLMACCTQRCCQGRVAADCFVRLHSLSVTQSLHVTWFENVWKHWTIVWLVLPNSDSLSQNPSRVFKWTAKWKHCWKSVKACGSLPW